jgi:hypothetical protein
MLNLVGEVNKAHGSVTATGTFSVTPSQYETS